LGILWGYVKAGLERAPRMDDPAYLRQLRRFELESLVLGKRRTVARHNERIHRQVPASQRGPEPRKG
jgi:hypothetical protein